MRSNSGNNNSNLNSAVFFLFLQLILSFHSFCCGKVIVSDLEAKDESSSSSSSDTALVYEPDNCQYGIRRLLREYDAFHHEDEILFPPMLQAAISKCIKGDGYDDLCEASSYEWIALNVAGMYRKFAEHELITLEREHRKNESGEQAFVNDDESNDSRDSAQNAVATTQRRAQEQEMPWPKELKAEQHHLDKIMGYISDARKFFEKGKLCHDMNRHLVLSKANDLEDNVAKKADLIQVEVKRLRSVSSSKKNEKNVPRKVDLIEAATCPNEVKKIHSQMILKIHIGKDIVGGKQLR